MDAFNLPVTLPVLLVLAFIPILLRQAVFYVNAWYSAVVSTRIGLRLRMQTLDAVLEADPAFFARHPVGHLVSVILTQTAVGSSAILAVIRQLSIALLMLVYVTILLALSVPLTLSILFFAVVVSLAIRANIGHIRDYGAVTARVTQEVWTTIVERFGMIRLIKLRDQKQLESGRIRDLPGPAPRRGRAAGAPGGEHRGNGRPPADALGVRHAVHRHRGVGHDPAPARAAAVRAEPAQREGEGVQRRPPGDLAEHGRAASGEGPRAGCRSRQHDPSGYGALRRARARARAHRRHLRVSGHRRPRRHARVRGPAPC